MKTLYHSLFSQKLPTQTFCENISEQKTSGYSHFSSVDASVRDHEGECLRGELRKKKEIYDLRYVYQIYANTGTS